MRYQEIIYNQEPTGLRNRDNVNVNMSSDVCIFEAPTYIMSGASKIICTGSTNTSYIVSSATTIPLSFTFTGNTNTFTATSATFKYEIYKFNENSDSFVLPPVYKSRVLTIADFTGATTTQSIPINSLNIDGEYLVKGYFLYNSCVEFGGFLGKTIDTLTFRGGTEYGLYNDNLDYYFLAMKSAEAPTLLANGSNTPPSNQLFQQVILPNVGVTNIVISQTYSGFFILTLNGLVLAPNLDYTYTGNVVTLSSSTVSGDIITVSYTTSGGNNLVGDNINISTAITSGTTNNEGTNDVYFNMSTSKYEIYTTSTPSDGGSIIVMLNGVTLANGVDYYQSTSNFKRIILEGELIVGDLITIVYFPRTSVVNGLITNYPTVAWEVTNPPNKLNGYFSLEVSSGDTFSTLSYSGRQDYVVGKAMYYDSFTASGSVGTKLYYRVKNRKDYGTLCGGVVSSSAFSETIEVVVQTNAINSY